VPNLETGTPLAPCVVVVKTPMLARPGSAARLAKSGRQVARTVVPAAAEHDRTLAALLTALARHGAEPLVIDVNPGEAARAALARARFVVSVGGDGTLLTASHYVKSGTLLGVNSAPRDSVGYLALAQRATIPRTLDAIVSGRLRPVPVARLSVTVDGVTLPEPALNDVLFAHQHPAATSRYLVRLGRLSETHRSSGLWVSTAAGSTAGIRSSGGAVMPLRSRRLQFRARELYRRTGVDFRLAGGFLAPGAELAVESQMEAGWLYVDGSRVSHRFPFGARAELRVMREPLLLFADPERWASAQIRGRNRISTGRSLVPRATPST
jgi:NAD+ kinase